MSNLRASVFAAALLAGVTGVVFAASADPFYQGPQACHDCHQPEETVFAGTKHATEFKDIHRNPKAKDIIAAAGGDANMRRNAVCTTCHYTMVTPSGGGTPTAQAGPSCESCHGPSSDWLNVHNDFGGPSAKESTETPAHKAQRFQKAISLGWIPPTMLYDIAENCLSCHELTRKGIDPAILAKMIDAGHPAGTSFELVMYSQGTVRHRFYPPDVTKNAEMTPAELARMYITGQAAALVKEKAAAAGGLNSPKYQDTLKQIDTSATTALNAVKDQVPEAAALLADPSDANARKLVDAIKTKDLSPQVGSLLPAKNTYK